jgi:hypothetical protein
MKHLTTFRMLIISAIILALVSTSTMAISKSDLISSYKVQPGASYNKSNCTDLISKPIIIPTWTSPTPLALPSDGESVPVWVIPTRVPSSGESYFPPWFMPSFWEIPSKNNTPFTRPSIYPTTTPTPPPAPTATPLPSSGCGYASCPPGKPVRYLIHTWCKCMSYRNVETGEVVGADCINPDTGQSYPIGMDALGTAYLVKPGCPTPWAD